MRSGKVIRGSSGEIFVDGVKMGETQDYEVGVDLASGKDFNTSIPGQSFTGYGSIILGKTIETEVLVDCPSCGKGIRWKKYLKPSGGQIAVMLTYCKCEWQGKRRKRVRRSSV